VVELSFITTRFWPDKMDQRVLPTQTATLGDAIGGPVASLSVLSWKAVP
jgi:hypothetical protein